QGLPQLHTQVAQCPVAGLVAQRVVELLEVVDVDQRERERPLAQAALPLESRELSLEATPVECTGQVVDQHLATRIRQPGLEVRNPLPQRLGAPACPFEALARSRDLAAQRIRLPRDRLDDSPRVL